MGWLNLFALNGRAFRTGRGPTCQPFSSPVLAFILIARRVHYFHRSKNFLPVQNVNTASAAATSTAAYLVLRIMYFTATATAVVR